MANLELLEKRFNKSLQPKIALLEKELARFKHLKHVGEIRHQGMIVGLELVEDPQTRKPFSPRKRIGHHVILAARQRGLILRPLGDVIVLMPILSMSLSELKQLLDITYDSIKQVTEGGHGDAC